MGLIYAPLKLTNLFSRQSVEVNAIVGMGNLYVRLGRGGIAARFRHQ